jgi:PAS domain S-box-containing protein
VGLAELLTEHREEIIREWIHRLNSDVSSRYRARSPEELQLTVSRACDASYAVLVRNDFSEIDGHIEWITDIRLGQGFLLSEVQNAYELYRIVLMPVLIRELEGEALLGAMTRVNNCLFYTITRFSDYFQRQHEKQIRDYAQDLEGEVAERTKELAESEAKYRVLVEEINDGYFVNENGIIVFANRAFCELHGLGPRDVVGRPYTEFVAAGSITAVRELYEKRMTGKESKDLYVYLRKHRDGKELPTENKVKRIVYEGKEAVAGICRDVTERMEQEKRMREAERLAHIGELTTSLAHEIRNPLSAVKMNLQILSKKIRLGGNDRRRAEIVSDEVTRLERILTEMLDFAKPVKLNVTPTEINSVVDSCLAVLDAKLKERGAAVRRNYSSRMPVVPMDADKMGQAIINVLINSLEASEERCRITITTRRILKNGRRVAVDILDNGQGIDEADFPYIFDPFFSRKKAGTGLGLVNVKKIVDAHGGTVRVAPVRPRGTLVTLAIPAGGPVAG